MKFNLEHIKNAFVYVTPNFNNSETIRYKFQITKILFYILIYSLFITTLTVFILGVTPLKNLVYHFESEELKVQSTKASELEKKVIFLTKELESISSANKKLNFAFILATSDSIDSTSSIYDSLKNEPNKNLPYGGNLYYIFSIMFNKLFQMNNEITFFMHPSNGLIINEFNTKKGHFGIDYAVGTGTSIVAAQGGLVLFSDFTIDDGHKIIIQHNNNFITVYKHCSSLIKKERDIVVQGELIALSGNSGKNTAGPHLHFEIWKEGKPKNYSQYRLKTKFLIKPPS